MEYYGSQRHFQGESFLREIWLCFGEECWHSMFPPVQHYGLDNKQKWNMASRLSNWKEIQTRHTEQNQSVPHESLLCRNLLFFPPPRSGYLQRWIWFKTPVFKTEQKKEMKLCGWLIYTLSTEHWKEPAVFWVCTFCLFISFNKLCISDFCQLLTAKTICLFAALQTNWQ